MKSNNYIENSLLHKRNMKIHNNLWKVYMCTLTIGAFIVLLKGLN